MTKVLVLYYSGYGHTETMAAAEAEGAGAVPGTEVTVKRVPELVPAAGAPTISWDGSIVSALQSSSAGA